MKGQQDDRCSHSCKHHVCAIGKCDDPVWEHDALNMGTSVIMWESYSQNFQGAM